MTKDKKNIPMYLACILLCLVLISTYMTADLFARYTAEGQGSDSARVAKFEIEADNLRFSTQMRTDIAPGVTTGDTIVVSNNSEVAVKYSVKVIKETDNLPLSFEVSTDGGSYEAMTQVMKDGQPTGEYTIEKNLVYGAAVNHVIRIIWDRQGAEQYMGMVDEIRIEIEAEQID